MLESQKHLKSKGAFFEMMKHERERSEIHNDDDSHDEEKTNDEEKVKENEDTGPQILFLSRNKETLYERILTENIQEIHQRNGILEYSSGRHNHIFSMYVQLHSRSHLFNEP